MVLGIVEEIKREVSFRQGSLLREYSKEAGFAHL